MDPKAIKPLEVQEHMTHGPLLEDAAQSTDPLVRDLSKALEQEQHRTKELTAQLHSYQNPGYHGQVTPKDGRPDDREVNEMITEEDTFAGALFEIADKYEAAVTNNLPRWQDGVFVREVGEFVEDVMAAVPKTWPGAFLPEPQQRDDVMSRWQFRDLGIVLHRASGEVTIEHPRWEKSLHLTAEEYQDFLKVVLAALRTPKSK